MRKLVVILLLAMLTIPATASALLPGSGTVRSSTWYDDTGNRDVVVVMGVTSSNGLHYDLDVELVEAAHGEEWHLYLRDDNGFHGWRGGAYIEGEYQLTEEAGRHHLVAAGTIANQWGGDFLVDVQWSA